MIYSLFDILSRTYIQYAFIVGVMMSLSGALLGVSLVLKKHSMIGDGLSHVGFGTVAIAACLGIAPLAFAIPLVMISSFAIILLSNKSKVFGDSAIALFSTVALAVGYAAIELGDGVNFNVESYLYGSLLGVTKTEVILSIVIALIVIITYIFLYNRIFSITFDETFSKSTGMKTTMINIILSILISLTIVIGMKVMGALLITSLIIFPTLASRQIFKSFKGVTIFSVIFSVISFTIGLVTACIITNLPIGSSIVFINFIFFMICFILGKIIGRKNN